MSISDSSFPHIRGYQEVPPIAGGKKTKDIRPDPNDLPTSAMNRKTVNARGSVENALGREFKSEKEKGKAAQLVAAIVTASHKITR